MARRIESLFLAGPVGKLEALLEEPEEGGPREAALVCHPHPQFGGTMHNKVVYRIARALRRSGSVVLRFNYRGVNQSEGVYGHGEGEREDARAALAYLRGRYPHLPVTLAGFSFGSRIVLRLGCEERADRIIAVGVPTNDPQKIYLGRCGARRVFVQSTRDQYGPVPSWEALLASAEGPVERVLVEAADHFFEGALDQLEEAIQNKTAGANPGRLGNEIGN